MYDFRPVDVSKEGISECVELLRIAFPLATHITNNYLDWQYNQNPTGQCVGFNAYSGQTLVAHYVTLPVTAMLFGEERRGLLSLNTATHPEHQGKRLFTTLAAKTYEYGQTLGYEFVVGVANANSTPGFVGKLGFQLVCPLDAKIGVGTVAKKKYPIEINFERTWDSTQIEWRLRNPSTLYHREQIHRGWDHILAPTGKFGIQAILSEIDVEKHLTVRDRVARKKLSLIKLWIGHDNNINWKRSAYIDVPKYLRLSPLNLIFKDLTEKNYKLSSNDVSFHAIDFDAY